MSGRNETRADDLNPADRELEAALMSLKPSPATLDSADALFEAGRRAAGRSTGRQLWAWRGLSAAMAVALAVVSLHRPEPSVIEREKLIVQAPPTPPQAIAALPPVAEQIAASRLPLESMFTLRKIAQERGIDLLPASPGAHLRLMRASDPATP